MREYSIELDPLPGQSTFVIGRYGVEAARLEGILRLNTLRSAKIRSNDARPQLPIVSGIVSRVAEQGTQQPIFQEATVSFVGTVVSTQPSCSDFQFVSLEQSIKCDQAPKDEINGAATLPGSWAWRINLTKEMQTFPPSRKVISVGALKKGRKLLRISYSLQAAASFITSSGVVRMRCRTPIEPFVVWPSLKKGSMRNIFLQVLRPIGYRWSNILPTAQYDLSVSSTVLGPGDRFDWGFRIVPRGHTCSNLFFKLVERYELLDKQQLDNPISVSANPILERTFISWDYRSTCKDNSESPSDDLFNQNLVDFVVPIDPAPNPTTTASELLLQENGTPSSLNTIPSDAMPMPRYGCVRHQIRIKITFNGAPSIRLECPVVILSVPASKLREYYILTRPCSSRMIKSSSGANASLEESQIAEPEDARARPKPPPELGRLPNTPASCSAASKSVELSTSDSSRAPLSTLSPIAIAQDDPLKPHPPPRCEPAQNGNLNARAELPLSNTASLAPPKTPQTKEDQPSPPKAKSAANRHTWDSPLSLSSSYIQKKIIVYDDAKPGTGCPDGSQDSTEHSSRTHVPIPVPLGKDKSDALETIATQLSALKLDNARISQKIADLESKLLSLMAASNQSPSTDTPAAVQSIPAESELSDNPNISKQSGAQPPTISGWRLPASRDASVEKRPQFGPGDLVVESNPMPPSAAVYPEPVNIKHTRPKFIKAKSNDLIYPRIPGSSIIKSAFGALTASYGANSSSSRIDDRRKNRVGQDQP